MKIHRTDQLQFIRFIAIIPIVLWHSYMMGYGIAPVSFNLRWYEALTWVVFFFMLSGFLSGYLSYEKDIKFSVGDSLKHLWKRLKKIYPLYLAVTLYSVSFSPLPGMIYRHAFDESFRYTLLFLIRHLLLLQSWFQKEPGEYYMLSEVGWFLSTMVFLYLIDVPLRAIASAVRNRARMSDRPHAERNVFALILIVTFVLTAVYFYLTRNLDNDYFQNVLPLARTGEYICGMSLGYLLYPVLNRQDKEEASYNRYVYTALEIISLLICFLMPFLPVSYWEFRVVRWLIPNLILISVFAAGRGFVSGLFRWEPLVYLGNISFAIYLTHSMVLRSITMFNLAGETIGNRMGQVATFMLSMSVVLLLSMLVSGRRTVKGGS